MIVRSDGSVWLEWNGWWLRCGSVNSDGLMVLRMFEGR